ncbi:ribonuclease P protein component [Candidatus Karelsulcia muelleri]
MKAFVTNQKLQTKYIIKKKQIVKKIFRHGKKIESNLLKVLYIETTNKSLFKIKLAFLVSKKQIRKSFKRNKIKRLMRMSYQFNTNQITLKPKIYYILFIYLKQKIHKFYEINKCFENVINKICCK